MRPWHRRTIAASALVIVAACASIPRSPALRVAGASSICGRISVRYKDSASGKEEASSGRFEWTRTGEDIELSLLDPLGQTVALIRTAPGRSSITFRDGRRVEGASPEALTQDTLGWTVPLRGLTAWLGGRPADGSPAVLLPDGRLRQDKWTIRFEPGAASARSDAVIDAGSNAASNAGSNADSKAPRRIDLFYPGPPAEIEMRLVIDRRGGS